MNAEQIQGNVDVVIVGGGVAGMACAIWSQRLHLRTMILEAQPRLGGQLWQIKNLIYDYPGVICQGGEECYQHFFQNLQYLQVLYSLNTEVEGLDTTKHLVQTNKGEVRTNYLVLATGARPRRLGIPGEEVLYAREETYSTSEQLERFTGKRILIVGGGDRAFEGAYRLLNVAKSIQIIHRSEWLRARAEYVEPVLQHQDVLLRLNHQCVKIEQAGEEKIVWIEGPQGISKEVYDFVLIRIGVEPYLPLALPELRTDGKGQLIINQFGQTTVPWVYAIGDLVNQPAFSAIAHSVGQGMVTAKHILLQKEESEEKERRSYHDQ